MLAETYSQNDHGFLCSLCRQNEKISSQNLSFGRGHSMPPTQNGQVTAEYILKAHDLALFPDSGSGGLCKARKHV